MKKVTAFLLSFLIICSCFTACKEDKTVDSFLAGGIWSARITFTDDTKLVIAFQFKEDGTFLFYQSISNRLIATASGYYNHDEEKEKLILSNADYSKEIEISCKYNEDSETITLNGPLAVMLGSENEDNVEATFAKVSKENEKYYSEDATIAYNIEKQT